MVLKKLSKIQKTGTVANMILAMIADMNKKRGELKKIFNKAYSAYGDLLKLTSQRVKIDPDRAKASFLTQADNIMKMFVLIRKQAELISSMNDLTKKIAGIVEKGI